MDYFELMMRDRKAHPIFLLGAIDSHRMANRQRPNLPRQRRHRVDTASHAVPLRGNVRFEKIAEQMWHRRLISPAEAAEYLELVRR